MMTTYQDWENRIIEERAKESLNAIVAPSVEDAVTIAENESLKYP